MTRRQRAFWMVTVPVAAMLAMNDRILGAQEPTAQPMVSRSGIDLGVARQDGQTRATTSTSSPAAAGSRATRRPPTSRATAGSRSCRNGTTPSCATSSTRPPSRRAAPEHAKDRRLLRQLHGRERRSSRKGTAPLAPDLDRVAAIKTRPTSRPSSATCTRSACRRVLRLRRGAGLQGRDAVHRDRSARAVSRCPIATTT